MLAPAAWPRRRRAGPPTCKPLQCFGIVLCGEPELVDVNWIRGPVALVSSIEISLQHIIHPMLLIAAGRRAQRQGHRAPSKAVNRAAAAPRRPPSLLPALSRLGDLVCVCSSRCSRRRRLLQAAAGCPCPPSPPLALLTCACHRKGSRGPYCRAPPARSAATLQATGGRQAAEQAGRATGRQAGRQLVSAASVQFCHSRCQ